MRAYLRLDPNFADRKAEYPDGAHRAYIDTLCFAEQQHPRGRFRSRRLLAVLLGKRGRWITFLIEHGDLIEMAAGKLYVDGWDEWQEGDVTVSERMKRLRSRRKGDTPTDTPMVTVSTVAVPSSGGGSGKHSAEAVGATPSRAANGSPEPEHRPFMGFGPRKPKPGSHEGQHDETCIVCHPSAQREPTTGGGLELVKGKWQPKGTA